MENKENAEIRALLTRSEEEMFKHIFDHYYSSLCTYALYYVNDQGEAEDIVQQFLIKLWEEKHIFQVGSSLKGYLRTGIRNQCINYLERKSTLRRKMQQMVPGREVAQALDFLLDDEERKVFEKALDNLPGQGRKALELVYFSGKSYKGAATVLNISVNTIKSHLKNALRHLKENPEIRQYYKEKVLP
jgi:RNA polymerase sigma-70 factor (ECF subfamily)